MNLSVINSGVSILSGVVLPSNIDTEDKFKDIILNRIKKIKKNRILLDRWKTTKLLLIDEISMIGMNYFDLLNIIAKSIRNNNLPFGGIQLVLSGDMCQLPPIKDGFIFESHAWKELDLIYINLSKAWRFTDEKYINLLQRIRLSKYTNEDIKDINNRSIKGGNNRFLYQKLGNKEDTLKILGSLISQNINFRY
jgi:ATP-dependent DNA helicase PIF1